MPIYLREIHGGELFKCTEVINLLANWVVIANAPFFPERRFCHNVFEKIRRFIRIASYAMEMLMQFVYTSLHLQFNSYISLDMHWKCQCNS